MNTTPYLTPTVLGLINNIRQNQDFSLCPILADALQDADFPEQVTVDELMGSIDDFFGNKPFLLHLRDWTDPVFIHRATACLLGGEYVESVKWIDELAKKMKEESDHSAWSSGSPGGYRMNYYILMDIANKKGYEIGPGYSWQDTFEENSNEFWKHYEIVTGKEVNDSWRSESLFGCSC